MPAGHPATAGHPIARRRQPWRAPSSGPLQSRHVTPLSPPRSYQASSGIGRRHGLSAMATPRLFATSDLHVAHPANWLAVEDLRGRFEQDWLIVAGDVAESVDDLRWTLHRL